MSAQDLQAKRSKAKARREREERRKREERQATAEKRAAEMRARPGRATFSTVLPTGTEEPRGRLVVESAGKFAGAFGPATLTLYEVDLSRSRREGVEPQTVLADCPELQIRGLVVSREANFWIGAQRAIRAARQHVRNLHDLAEDFASSLGGYYQPHTFAGARDPSGMTGPERSVVEAAKRLVDAVSDQERTEASSALRDAVAMLREVE